MTERNVTKQIRAQLLASEMETLGRTLPDYRGDWHALRQYRTSDGPRSRQLWVWFEPDLLPGYAWSFPLPDGRVNFGFGIVRGDKLSGKQLNEVCGGTCDVLGKCADGLTCEKPQQSPFSFAVLVTRGLGAAERCAGGLKLWARAA